MYNPGTIIVVDYNLQRQFGIITYKTALTALADYTIKLITTDGQHYIDVNEQNIHTNFTHKELNEIVIMKLSGTIYT